MPSPEAQDHWMVMMHIWSGLTRVLYEHVTKQYLILKQATKAQAFKASWSSLSPAGEGDNHILFIRLVLRYFLIAIDCFSYSSLGGLRHSAGDDLGATYRFTLPQTGSSDLVVCLIEVQESYRYKRYIDNTKRKIDRFISIRSKAIRSLKTIRPVNTGQPLSKTCCVFK